MRYSILDSFNGFMNNSEDYPLFVGFISGFYPMVFYYSNNFESINSYPHFFYFSFLFLVLPSLGTYVLYTIFRKIPKLNPLKRHLLVVLIIVVTSVFLSQVYFLSIKTDILAFILLTAILLTRKHFLDYKKILVFIVLLSLIPVAKCVLIIANKYNNDAQQWMKQNDKIEEVRWRKTPNIYFLEPDGYTGKQAMKQPPYNYNDGIYSWLESNSFTVYNDTRSNYPASLASNASMFVMKHHYLQNIPNSPFEMQEARSIILGDNPVIRILKNNNYKTYFIVEDGYFQQNFKEIKYDFHNIQNEEIPFFSNDNNAKKDVFKDLKKCIETDKENARPKFFFIEKLVPHHIHFDGTGVENERKEYLKRVGVATSWLKKTVDLIVENDPSGIIIIASDHGGWVGCENLNQMFTSTDEWLMKSIFCNLIAIKWNDTKHVDFDTNLKSNVNIFRVLFAYLSQDKSVLNSLEKDTSYTIQNDGMFSKKGVEVSF